MQDILLNYSEVSPAQYGKLMGISKGAVIRRCEQGLLDAYRVGSHWKIKIPLRDAVSRVEYEKIAQENAELKATVEAIRKLLPPA